MSKPSNNWISNLILLIQECHAENDQSFVSFIQDLTWGEGDGKYDDYKMVQKLKALQSKNFTQFPFNVELIDQEKSLNEA